MAIKYYNRQRVEMRLREKNRKKTEKGDWKTIGKLGRIAINRVRGEVKKLWNIKRGFTGIRRKEFYWQRKSIKYLDSLWM